MHTLSSGPVLAPVLKTDSIRWRLPLSYAAIALLATISLGILLLLILRGFYLRQERDFLNRNAQAIANQLAPFLRAEIPQGALQSQVEGYAFLTQTRVRLLDADGRPLADSEEHDQNTVATLSIQVDVGGVTQAFSQTLEEGSPNISYRSAIVVEGGGSKLVTDDRVRGSATLVSEAPVVATPYGFGLGWSASASQPRSSQRAVWPVEPPGEERSLGYVELSQGPAYGREVVARVAWGWAIASVLSVLLAGAAGVWISRRLSQPVLDLAAVTLRMVEGDLAARADLKRKDELGTLGLAFNEMARRVEETILALRQFVSDAAHELQTPLTVLHSDLDLIRARLTDPEQFERIDRARSQVARLEAVSSGLLELSRVEAGTGARQPLSLNKIVAESCELAASRAEQAGLAFSLELPQVEVILIGDETQLRRALDNLLDNALKFNRESGSVEIRLQIEGDWAVIRVVDSGIGIPTNDLPHLFRRFHRGRNAADYPGSGLGLAIVKAIIEGHAGTVTLESGSQGTTACVHLPT